MEILGVGPLELFFILIIALILLGPKDMAKAGRTLGRWVHKLITSQFWQQMRQTSRTVRTLSTQVVREAGLEDLSEQLQDGMPDLNEPKKPIGDWLKQDIDRQAGGVDLSSWTTPPPMILPPDTAAQAAPVNIPEEKPADE